MILLIGHNTGLESSFTDNTCFVYLSFMGSDWMPFRGLEIQVQKKAEVREVQMRITFIEATLEEIDC